MPILNEIPGDLAPVLARGREAAGGNGRAHGAVAPAGQDAWAFATDLTLEGVFGREWLVVDGEWVHLLRADGAEAATRLTLPLHELSAVRAETFVGNGVIRAQRNGSALTLVRFSHGLAREAHAVARRLDAHAQGGPPPPAPRDVGARRCPRCRRPLPEDSDVCQACVDRRAVLLRLFRFLRPYKLQAGAGLAVLAGVTALELAPPYLAGRVVDALVSLRTAPDRAMATIASLVALMAAARIAHAGLAYAQRRLNSFIGARTLMDIRVALFHRFNELSLGYYDRRSTGSLMSRVTNDADNLWDFLMDGAPFLVSNTLALALTSVVLFRMNWQLAALLLIPAPFIAALTRWFLPRARARFRRVWHRISRMYAALNSSLAGMRVIKAFAQEERENARFEERNRRVFEASYHANSMWAVYMPALGLLMALGAYIIWLVGGWMVLHQNMTLGTLTAFSGYLMQFYAPFQNFNRALDWSTRSLTAAERVFEVLDTEPEVRESPRARPLPAVQGRVQFDSVSFSYDGATRVLEDFSLTVQPGEMIGLVGPSGAGKTTLINLLARFYDVTEGAIRIDDIDIRDIRLQDFRRQLGIVLQEPFLFPGTIRDNIAYSRPDASHEEVLRAAKAANAHEFILRFPDGYDTHVGERGQRLSGGQRQRISIARAILHNPRILIFDEATSSVDTHTEKLIQEAIARLVQNRTTFAIAHRLSTLRHADRLVVLKDGRMAECGTHDQLMQQHGVYAELVRIQTEASRIRAV